MRRILDSNNDAIAQQIRQLLQKKGKSNACFTREFITTKTQKKQKPEITKCD